MKLAPRARKVPAHIALIPDGNRRWAKSHRLSILNGYKQGFDKFIPFSFWAKALGVKTLTVWGLSTENIRNRSKAEIGTLFYLYMTMIARNPRVLRLLLENNSRIRFIGNMKLLPARLRKALMELEAKTSACRDFTINLLIGYGGRDDLLYAASRVRSPSEEEFGRKIRTSMIPEVDLLIRTSGEHRLSGLLPWQTDYSEIYFSKKLWPDFQRRDLKRAIDSYAARERRFGK
jgi:undecaprenyl diphosphate synthase